MLNTKMTMIAALREVAEAHLKQEALVCGDTRLTYGQLLERIDTLARGMSAIGIGKGAKVACILDPGLEFVYLFFAVAKIGAVLVPLSPQVRSLGLNEVLCDAEPVALVTARTVEKEVISKVPSLRHVILADDAGSGSMSLEKLLTEGKSGQMPKAELSPQDLLVLLYTSGTTGVPKGTMHSHSSLLAPVVASVKLRELWINRPSLKSLSQTVKALGRYRRRLLRAAGRPQTFLSTSVWHTITGLETMLQALMMGDRLVVMPRFHPRQAMQLVEKERVTVIIAVPMAYQIMLRLEDFDQFDTSSLLICGAGAAPCSKELAQEMQRRFGCAVHIGFGATETGGGISATSLADSDDLQTGTVGRPMPGMEVKVVDEQRNVLPAGEVGELVCRSDSLMLGYYRAPEVTAEVIDADGWYYTGDLARMDEKGYIEIIGRKKDVIIRGGQNIYPPEIETYLTTHPKIREAAVVGIPSAVGGENVWAFVLLEVGEQMVSQEVLDYCREALEPCKIPSQVEFVNDFPRTGTGKPQKYKLREETIKKLKGGIEQ